MSGPRLIGVVTVGRSDFGIYRPVLSLLAPRIRVNCIAPGGIRTNQPAEFQERYNSRTPLGRMATPEDVKGALAYLASDLSAYVTGQILSVDGGWTAW